MEPSKTPPSADLTLIEWCRYDWRGARGSLNTYVYKQGDKSFRVVHCDIRHDPGSTNSRQPGWDRAQEIDGHQFSYALERARQCPQIPKDIYLAPPVEAVPAPEVSQVVD